jgi:hypothetical protein
MNTLFIIDTYPSSKRQMEILSSCIDSIKALDYKIMITTHLPIPESITQKVEYVIYDYDNSFLKPEYTPFYWLKSETFDVHIFNAGHTLPICRNIKNGVNMAQILGFDSFIFMESDIIFGRKDIEQLDFLLYKMERSNKKMLFFKPEEYRGTENSYVYETLLFGGICKYFNDTFQPPTDLKEWLFKEMGYTLEQTFYDKFKHNENEYLIINHHSSEIFRDSEVNISRYGLFNCELIHNDTHEDEPVLFIMNSLVEELPKYAEIIKNDVLENTYTLHKGQYWFNSYRYDGSIITVNIYDDLESQYLYFSKTFHLHSNNITIFKEKGNIKLK